MRIRLRIYQTLLYSYPRLRYLNYICIICNTYHGIVNMAHIRRQHTLAHVQYLWCKQAYMPFTHWWKRVFASAKRVTSTHGRIYIYAIAHMHWDSSRNSASVLDRLSRMRRYTPVCANISQHVALRNRIAYKHHICLLLLWHKSWYAILT